jgi:hypothetical protein
MKLRTATIAALAVALATHTLLVGAAPAAELATLDVGAKVYFDYRANLTDYPAGDQTPTQGFGLRRVYLTVKKSLGDFGFRYTTDIDTKYGAGTLNAYTKYAYLHYAGLPGGAKLLVGQHSPESHGWIEERWHYRSMAKTMSDDNKWTRSAELGVGLQGHAVDDRLAYALDFNNGNGYKSPLRKDGIGFAARLTALPTPEFTLSALFTSNTEGTHEDGNGGITGTDQADTYLEGLAGFENDRYSFYALYGYFTDGPTDIDSAGLSLFGRAALTDGLFAVGRVDLVDPDTDSDSDSHTFLLAGLDCAVTKGFYLQPSVRVTSFAADGLDSQTEILLTFYGKI